jgi:hypothetical protein
MNQRTNETTYIDPKRGDVIYEAVEDISEALNDNLASQADPDNGFTAGRTMRKVANIPVSVYHQWARSIGYYSMSQADKWIHMRKFLKDNPQYSSVDKLKHNTVNQGSIIIK